MKLSCRALVNIYIISQDTAGLPEGGLAPGGEHAHDHAEHQLAPHTRAAHPRQTYVLTRLITPANIN